MIKAFLLIRKAFFLPKQTLIRTPPLSIIYPTNAHLYPVLPPINVVLCDMKLVLLISGWIVFSTIPSNTHIMNNISTTHTDHSNKSILARGCDPALSAMAAKEIPKHIGNPSYTPTTDDETFFKLLQTHTYSIVYFAPGACRFSAANMQIPGSNGHTKTWTLEEYKARVYQYQGPDVIIIETPYESESIELLNRALTKARATT